MHQGFWTIGKWQGAPIRLHWSIALGVLFFGGFRFAPAIWIGFVLLVLVHEFGHALLVRSFRLPVLEIAVHGFGGYCRHAPTRTREQDAVIAWGGVLAQGAAFALTQLVVLALGPPTTSFSAQLYHVFTTTNLWIILINLIPFEPLDGAKAWPLLPMLWRRYGARSSNRDPRGRGRRMDAEQGQKLVRDLLDRTTKPKSKPDA